MGSVRHSCNRNAVDLHERQWTAASFGGKLEGVGGEANRPGVAAGGRVGSEHQADIKPAGRRALLVAVGQPATVSSDRGRAVLPSDFCLSERPVDRLEL